MNSRHWFCKKKKILLNIESINFLAKMYLMYTLNENGDRVYTLKVRESVCKWIGYRRQWKQRKRWNDWWWIFDVKHILFPESVERKIEFYFQKQTEDGKPTISAHPARFSPEDKYSRQRIVIKKRFGLLLTQQPKPIYWQIDIKHHPTYRMQLVQMESVISSKWFKFKSIIQYHFFFSIRFYTMIYYCAFFYSFIDVENKSCRWIFNSLYYCIRSLNFI